MCFLPLTCSGVWHRNLRPFLVLPPLPLLTRFANYLKDLFLQRGARRGSLTSLPDVCLFFFSPSFSFSSSPLTLLSSSFCLLSQPIDSTTSITEIVAPPVAKEEPLRQEKGLSCLCFLRATHLQSLVLSCGLWAQIGAACCHFGPSSFTLQHDILMA